MIHISCHSAHRFTLKFNSVCPLRAVMQSEFRFSTYGATKVGEKGLGDSFLDVEGVLEPLEVLQLFLK